VTMITVNGFSSEATKGNLTEIAQMIKISDASAYFSCSRLSSVLCFDPRSQSSLPRTHGLPAPASAGRDFTDADRAFLTAEAQINADAQSTTGSFFAGARRGGRDLSHSDLCPSCSLWWKLWDRAQVSTLRSLCSRILCVKNSGDWDRIFNTDSQRPQRRKPGN